MRIRKAYKIRLQSVICDYHKKSPDFFELHRFKKKRRTGTVGTHLQKLLTGGRNLPDPFPSASVREGIRCRITAKSLCFMPPLIDDFRHGFYNIRYGKETNRNPLFGSVCAQAQSDQKRCCALGARRAQCVCAGVSRLVL